MSRARILRTAVGFSLLVSAELLPQVTGSLAGVVVRADGSPEASARVSIHSSDLPGIRDATTDAAGEFRFLALPPGDYSVRVELDGRIALETETELPLDRDLYLELRLPDAAEEITVYDRPSVIDPGATTTGGDFPERTLESLPLPRTFQNVALAVPGVTSGGLADNPSIRGASAAENRYLVDGLDITDPGFGTIASGLAMELIDQVEVKTGGYEAEYGGALGGLINVITKSGGNEHHGDLFGYYNDEQLAASSPETERSGQQLGTTTYDIGASAGGRIVQDRLWYFVAVNPATNTVALTNQQGIRFDEREERLFYAGKLSWQPDSSQRLVASVFGDPTDTTDTPNPNAIGRMGYDQESGADSISLTYDRTTGSNLLFELQGGRYDQRGGSRPFRDTLSYSDWTVGALWANAQECGEQVEGAGIFFSPECVGGLWVGEEEGRRRDQIRGAASWFADNHAVKAGLEYREVRYIRKGRHPGGLASPLIDSTGTVVAADGLPGGQFHLYDGFHLLASGQTDSEGETQETALYLQDTWNLGPRFRVNFGFRFESLDARGNASSEFPDRRLKFGLDEMIAPRLGLTWDPVGSGRSKLFASFGHFYESVPLDINVRMFGRERFDLYFFLYPESSSLPTYEDPGTYLYGYTFGAGSGVDGGIEPMYTEEWMLGYEQEVGSAWTVAARAVYREARNVVEDISLDGGAHYFLTNPGGTYSVNPATGEALPEPVPFPSARREYRSAELVARRRFADDWQLETSYVYSRNEGNYGGLFRQDNGQLDPNITSLFDLPELLDGADGPLPNDRRHHLKAFGSWRLPLGLETGFFAEYVTGAPISKLGAHPTYGPNERFVTSRGSAGRSPDLWHLDLRFDYPISIGGLELHLLADVFNLTNEQRASTVDQTWTFAALERTEDPGECGGPETGAGTACPEGNPFWGTATAYQSPRTVRLGLRLRW